MEGFVAVMKIIINQNGSGFFTVGNNQFYNISNAEIDGSVVFSVGVENISFGLYKKENRAIAALNALMSFVTDDACDTYRFEPDK